MGEQRDYSDAVALEIDKEVQQLVNTAYGRAREVLTENRNVLEAIAKRLIEVETIEEEEFRSFFTKGTDTGGSDNTPFNPRPKLPTKNDGKDESSSTGAVPAPAPA